VFIEYEPTAYFTGGRPAAVASITATIRAGFDDALRSELLTRLPEPWSSITGHYRRRITVSLDEIDASSRMGGGMILPSLGEEAIWARSHAHELGELGVARLTAYLESSTSETRHVEREAVGRFRNSFTAALTQELPSAVAGRSARNRKFNR
jgi:hypothetical protein